MLIIQQLNKIENTKFEIRNSKCLFHLMSLLNTYIENYSNKSEAEVIAVKIQDLKRIPTSYLS